MKTGSGGRPLKIIIFALLVVVGALIAVQIRSVRAVDSELDYAQKVKLKEYSGRIESLSAEIDELERSTASMNYRYSARLEQLSEKGGRVYEISMLSVQTLRRHRCAVSTSTRFAYSHTLYAVRLQGLLG